jgi:hypothetical protein
MPDSHPSWRPPAVGVLSEFCTRACLPTGSHLRPAPTRYRWRPLRTARSRWRVDQTWTKPATLSGPVGLDQAPWSGVVGPARPGRPTCRLPDDRACYRRTRILIYPHRARGSVRCATPRRPCLPHHGQARGPRGSKPAPRCSGERGQERERCCDLRLRRTRRDRWCPSMSQIPDAARTSSRHHQ